MKKLTAIFFSVILCAAVLSCNVFSLLASAADIKCKTTVRIMANGQETPLVPGAKVKIVEIYPDSNGFLNSHREKEVLAEWDTADVNPCTLDLTYVPGRQYAVYVYEMPEGYSRYGDDHDWYTFTPKETGVELNLYLSDFPPYPNLEYPADVEAFYSFKVMDMITGESIKGAKIRIDMLYRNQQTQTIKYLDTVDEWVAGDEAEHTVHLPLHFENEYDECEFGVKVVEYPDGYTVNASDDYYTFFGMSTHDYRVRMAEGKLDYWGDHLRYVQLKPDYYDEWAATTEPPRTTRTTTSTQTTTTVTTTADDTSTGGTDTENVTTTAAEPETGDIDEDGLITAYDASLILTEYTLRSGGGSSFDENKEKAADVDGDGLITAYDASLVLSYYTYLAGDDATLGYVQWYDELMKQN